MNPVHLILLVFAFVLSFLAAIGVPAGKYGLLAAAFCCFIASLFL